MGEKTKAALIEQGFADVQSVAGSALEALVEVKGIGKAKAKKLIEEAKKLLEKL